MTYRGTHGRFEATLGCAVLRPGRDGIEPDRATHREARLPRKYHPIVIHEGDEALSLYLIVSGAVKVFLSDDNGKQIVVNTQHEGEYFGELALLDDAPRSASVMTTEASTFLVLNKHDFDHILREHPTMALPIMRQLASRVRLLSENVKSLALLDVYGRLARTLLMLAEPGDDGRLAVREKLTQQELANRIGASREMVARILKDLATGGYISIEKRRITINEKLPAAY